MSHTKNKPGLGFRLPGMVAIDRNVSTGMEISADLEALLVFSPSALIRVNINKSSIDGESIESEETIKPESKLSHIRGMCPGASGGMFIIFGFETEQKLQKKCLMVTFIPEAMKVRSKMLFASSKGVIKKAIATHNTDMLIEEYHCTELKEISEEVYMKKKTVEKPFTEAEKQRMEEDKMEKGGGENFLAVIMKKEEKNAYALPGFGLGMKPSEVKKNRIASMAIARTKDEERNQRVDFLLKLKEEKEKMEKEMALAKEKAAEEAGEERKSDGEKKEIEKTLERPITEVLDLNEVDTSDDEEED